MNVLVLVPVKEKHKKYLADKGKNCTFIYNPTPSKEEMAKADVIFGTPPPSRMQEATSLKWLQLSSAGAEKYCRIDILPAGVQLTNSTGAYGQALSEYMLAVLLAMQKNLYLYHDNQKNHLWHDEGPVTTIFDKNVLILGLGDIGKNFAQKAKTLGANIIGIKRRHAALPAYVDELYTLEDLDYCLKKADVIVNCLPGTAATYHLLDKEKFDLMKKGSLFINVGRGSAVVTEALCNAVESGHLAAAAVDVTDPEPLPAEHRMWQIKNIHITPHVAGQYHLAATLDNVVEIAGENLERFLEKQPLHNEVDFATGYKK